MKTVRTVVLCFLLIPFIAVSQPRGTGMKFDLKLYSKAEKADFTGLGFTTTLPASVSWKDYAPYPKDQGQTSTCVGWSTTYGALTIENAKQLGLKDKSKITAKAFCPYFTYNQLRNPDDYSCQVGVYIYNALTALRTYGSKRYYLPVYECGTKIDENSMRNSKPFRIKSFKKLFDYPYETQEWSFDNFYNKWDVDKVTPVKQALANGHVVPFGMQVPESFFYVVGADLWQPTADELALIPNLTTYGHAMCVVGYDDSKYGGAFEIMNSWGENWGVGGFSWIKYADFKKFVVDAYYFEMFDEAATATSGCVTGDCQNTYSRMIFPSGDEFEGNFKNGTYEGYGIYTWADGHVYAGQWKAGKRDGLGTSIAPGGQPYTETWQNDAPSLYSNTDIKSTETGCQSGDCNNGFGTFKYDNGSYTGTFQYGLRKGFGTYNYNDGGKITATWLADQVSGFGKLHYTDGYVYIGEFDFDMQNGYGLEYGIDGYIAGEWLFGVFMESGGLGFAAKSTATESKLGVGSLKPKMGAGVNTCMEGDCNDGQGTMRYDTGDSYSGYFKGGYRDGYGIYTWSNGIKYEGSWLAGNMDGVGKIYFPEGSYFIGEFRKGLQDGYGIEITGSGYMAGVWEFGKYQPGKATLGFAEFKKKKGEKTLDLRKSTPGSPAAEKTLKEVAAKKVAVK